MQVKDILYKREKGQGFLASFEYEKGLNIRPNVDGYYECFIKDEDLKKLEDEIYEKGRDLSDKRQEIEGLKYELKQLNLNYQGLKNQYFELQEQNKNLQERSTKFSKANGKKEQKRSLEDPDYKIDRIEINKKGYFYTYITPFTIKNLKISLKELEKTIEKDLTQLLKGDNQYFKADIQKIYTFNDVFMVTIKTDKEIG